jgi:hypothetical protein
LLLSDAKQRRLFNFLLQSPVREPTGLPKEFVDGLASAFEGADDPAAIHQNITTSAYDGPWRLQSIETRDFGGLNTWQGGPFTFVFGGESLLLEGPNGSGKSSFIGAILWALTGERPRDQSDDDPQQAQPVFSLTDKQIGDWPPIASYPPTPEDFKSSPVVEVKVVLRDVQDRTIQIERTLSDGKVAESTTLASAIPAILLEAGLLMPSRMAKLRFREGRGRLTDAVQTLTGLDDLIAIGLLATGLCHQSREYLSYKAREFATNTTLFEQGLVEARKALSPVSVTIPAFGPADTDDPDGELAVLGRAVASQAAELAQVVATDLSPQLELSVTRVQNRVIAAIAAAEDQLRTGLEGLESWKRLRAIGDAFDEAGIQAATTNIAIARAKLEEAIRFHDRTITDTKFQLKAVAARWHAQHSSGGISDCPLCEESLKNNDALVRELSELKSATEAATRTLENNVASIRDKLEASLPKIVSNSNFDDLLDCPRRKITEDIRANFVLKDHYANCLVGFASLVDQALTEAPTKEFVLSTSSSPRNEDPVSLMRERILATEGLTSLAMWFKENAEEWSRWWTALVSDSADGNGSRHERLMTHLSRLSDALSKAEPYRNAAEILRGVWAAGKNASVLGKEITKRNSIAESLASLKSLSPLCEAVARDAINGLSGRISALLKQIMLTEDLQFHGAKLDRKEGLIVRGGFAPDVHIDATLVANTSWLRAVLWCFVFSLREEAVEQLGADPFPVMVFDDPQMTFDNFHRARWVRYVASRQNSASNMQVILATYDEAFLDLVKMDGLTGRGALIASPGPGCDHAAILEGAALDRKWVSVQTANVPAEAVNYLQAVRVHVEGMLKLMLRGEDAGVHKLTLGRLRDLLRQLSSNSREPWDRPVFKALVGLLAAGRSEIKYLEGSHHTTGSNFGTGEATDVEKYWRKELAPILDRAYRTARDHRLLHGGLKALHAAAPSASLPRGYSTKVRTIPLKVLGRAAALSDGKVADGALDVTEFAVSDHIEVVLDKHSAYRLTAKTLEPVARVGDIVLVKEKGEPSSKSLVVALTEDRILARRFEISEDHSDIAVLAAQAINPREIANPVVNHRATLTLHKIIGVLFAANKMTGTLLPGDEVCDCGGEASLGHFTRHALGLMEVDGRSAEPIALHGQYLIVQSPISPEEAAGTLGGRPVIAEDASGSRLFKRFYVPQENLAVLESLEIGGNYKPILLSMPGHPGNQLKRVWPVVGVLFER